MSDTTPDERARVVDLHERGESAPTIAAITGVPVHRVRLVLKDEGYSIRGGGRSDKHQSWPQIAALMATCNSFHQVATQAEIPYQTVMRWAREEGVVDHYKGQKDAKRGEALKLAAQHLSQPEIALRLNVSPSTVARWLRTAQTKTHGQRGKPPVKRDRLLPEVLVLHGAGKTTHEIAKEVGAHWSTVGIWLKGQGIEPNYGLRPSVAAERKMHPKRAEAIQLFLAGHTAHEVEQTLGIGRGQVAKWARDEGVYERGGKAKKRELRKDRVRELLVRGGTADTIKDDLKIHYYEARDLVAEVQREDGDKVMIFKSITGHTCPCGKPTGSPYRLYCGPEHRIEYGEKRQEDPDNWVDAICQNDDCPTLGGEFRYRRSQPQKYCSRKCANRHTKKTAHFADSQIDQVYDSSWEVLFGGICGLLKIPFQRFDRSAVEPVVVDGTSYEYGPDFTTYHPDGPIDIEVKGQVSDLVVAKGDAYRQQGHRLVVLDQEALDGFRFCSTRSVAWRYLADLAASQAEKAGA